MVSEGDCAKRLKGRSAEARRAATADGLFITSPSYCGDLGLTIWKTLTFSPVVGRAKGGLAPDASRQFFQSPWQSRRARCREARALRRTAMPTNRPSGCRPHSK